MHTWQDRRREGEKQKGGCSCAKQQLSWGECYAAAAAEAAGRAELGRRADRPGPITPQGGQLQRMDRGWMATLPIASHLLRLAPPLCVRVHVAAEFCGVQHLAQLQAGRQAGKRAGKQGRETT